MKVDSRSITPPTNPILTLGAAEIARRIAGGEVSSREAASAFIDRIEAVDPQLNAVCWPMFDAARDAAARADEAQARGEKLGSLHGVPITIKECFHFAGTPSTMGLTALRNQMDASDGPLVARLKAAGAVVLGQTNVPQLMILHETDNPVYGRTNNPHDLSRTPGGSSGGEGAIIAAGGSPLGLGSDLGGSIRIPAHFCGIAGLKPTTFRLSKQGAVENLRGMESLHFQPGPMARQVEDLELAMGVMCGQFDAATEEQESPVPWRESRNIDVSKLRIGVFETDDYAHPHAAVRRAVEQAATALREAGATVEPFDPPDAATAMALYFGIVGADGAADLRRLTQGSTVDHRVAAIIRLGATPRWLRPALAAMLRAKGKGQLADLVAAAGPRSADGYWRLTHQAKRYVRDFLARLNQANFDAILCPPHAHPAFPHGQGGPGMMIAASYAFVMNLLGIPCGVVPVTTVQPDEAHSGEAGLPIGVQIAAQHWREDIVLAVMGEVQRRSEAAQAAR